MLARRYFVAIQKLYFSGTSGDLLRKEFHQNDTVLRLVLSDVKRRNALSMEMLGELSNEMKIADGNHKIRSVIIAADGPAFSSGHDLKQLKPECDHKSKVEIFDRCASLLQYIQRMSVPVIAEVNGVAAAAGCQLVATCDIAVAGESSQFSVPGQKVGFFCSTPGVALVRNVPRKMALDMLMTGEPINAKTALSCGLVSRVVPDDQVKFEALKVAEQIGKHSRSVTALGKTFFYAQAELKQAEAYRYGSVVMTENLKMTDAQEGIKAFIEKRKPEFSHTDERVTDGEGEKKEDNGKI